VLEAVMKSDEEVVLKAVTQDGRARQHASEELKGNQRSCWTGPSEELKDINEFMLEAVKQHVISLQRASEELRSDKEVMLEAVKQAGYGFSELPRSRRRDRSRSCRCKGCQTEGERGHH
jgi:hypothetical protein